MGILSRARFGYFGGMDDNQPLLKRSQVGEASLVLATFAMTMVCLGLSIWLRNNDVPAILCFLSDLGMFTAFGATVCKKRLLGVWVGAGAYVAIMLSLWWFVETIFSGWGYHS
ncbi:MAG TPA: hypothetical protein VGX76_00490 [Pirellulales bacterium]|jgi:hypothetical protein|nr:hypothetical protein [Pirellulales bacterium]